MEREPPISTRTDTLFPYTKRVRSAEHRTVTDLARIQLVTLALIHETDAIETLFAASHGSLRIESVRSKFKGSLAGVPPRRFVSERKFAAACATRSLMIRRQARITTPRHHRRQKEIGRAHV